MALINYTEEQVAILLEAVKFQKEYQEVNFQTAPNVKLLNSLSKMEETLTKTLKDLTDAEYFWKVSKDGSLTLYLGNMYVPEKAIKVAYILDTHFTCISLGEFSIPDSKISDFEDWGIMKMSKLVELAQKQQASQTKEPL